MHLINEGKRCWLAKRCIAFPVVFRRIDYNALHRSCSVVPWLACGLSAVVVGDNHAASIGIEKNLVGIETQTIVGIEWTVDPISIELS